MTDRTKLLALLVSLTLPMLPSLADAKPRHKRVAAHDTRWMRDCIHERTGPVGGVSRTEARAICKAEQPDDDVAAARTALAVARTNAKLTKARERAFKAIEACEQAVVDGCVAMAPDDGSVSCEDADLKTEFAVCH